EQARNSAVALGIPADSITVLPGDARSTLTEAAVVRDYLKLTPGIDTLMLVSSPAHMRRASMIFKTAFRNSETPVYIGCSPSSYSDFDPKHWWRKKEDIQTVLSEFIKIGSFVLFEKRELK
ncbi:MAG: YdcF family protein, partial [Bacteroidales bacterium]|nr:YdcF family protein [Bacteroidales bacterium]